MQDDLGIDYWKSHCERLTAEIDILEATLAALQTKRCSLDVSHITDDNKRLSSVIVSKGKYKKN
jgi:hypothetical protein